MRDRTYRSDLELLPPPLRPRPIDRRTELPLAPFALALALGLRPRLAMLPMPHRPSPARPSQPALPKRLRAKPLVPQEHPQVAPVPQVLKRLRGVLDRKLRDVRAREDVRVDGGVERGAVARVLVRREDDELGQAEPEEGREAEEGVQRAVADEVVGVLRARRRVWRGGWRVRALFVQADELPRRVLVDVAPALDVEQDEELHPAVVLCEAGRVKLGLRRISFEFQPAEGGEGKDETYVPHFILSLLSLSATAFCVFVYLLAVRLERARVLLDVLEELVQICFVPYTHR